MPAFRLGEETVRLFNPMPDTEMQEIIEKVGLLGRWPYAHGQRAFEVEYTYSMGREKEEIRIKPGQSYECPKSLSSLVYRRKREEGLVVLSRTETTSEQIMQRALEGLNRAHVFYNERGTAPIQKFRRRHQIRTDAEFDAIKYKIPGNLINAERARLIDVEIKRIAKGGKLSIAAGGLFKQDGNQLLEEKNTEIETLRKELAEKTQLLEAAQEE